MREPEDEFKKKKRTTSSSSLSTLVVVSQAGEEDAEEQDKQETTTTKNSSSNGFMATSSTGEGSFSSMGTTPTSMGAKCAMVVSEIKRHVLCFVLHDVPRFLRSLDIPRDLVYLIPLVLWLMMFQFAGSLDSQFRPPIDVTVLPWLEGAFFGESLLYQLVPQQDLLVLISAIPYLAHFSLPFLFLIYLIKVDGKPHVFYWYFGVLNLTGVMTHMLFPTAPPWYNGRFGYEPASYDIQGDPGRLLRADDILGYDIFQTIYGNSPLVFGSFPSLHAGWPFLICLYVRKIDTPFLPQILRWGYVFWLWGAAVYLKHHFFLDVLGGALYSFLAIYLSDRFIFHVPPKSAFDPSSASSQLSAIV